MTTEEIKRELDKVHERVKQLEAELKKTEEESSKNKLNLFRKQGETYSTVTMHGGNLCVATENDSYHSFDNSCYDNNNYFLSEERAQEVANKIKFLLKLERLHDIYCPDYKPDWKSPVPKYYICNDTSETKWYSNNVRTVEDAVQVYFPSQEIARQVCTILNKELQ